MVSPRLVSHCFATDGGKSLLTVELPFLDSLDDVDLEMSAKEVRLLLPGAADPILLALPMDFDVCAESAAAKFSRKRKQLIVSWSPAVQVLQTPAPTENIEEAKPAACVGDVDIPWMELPGSGSEKQNQSVDCMHALREEIEHRLKKCTIDRFRAVRDINSASIQLSDFQIDGSATLEGATCNFQVRATFKWEAFDGIGGRLGVTGTGEVSGLSDEQELPQISMRRLSTGGVSPQGRAASEWLQKKGVKELASYLRGPEIAAATAESARLEPESQAQSQQPASQAPTLRKMSEQDATLWAKAWLTRKLEAATVRLFGGSATGTLSSPEVSGSVSLTWSTSNKLAATLALRLECSWVVAAGGGGEARGSLSANLDPDQKVRDIPITVEPGPGARGQLVTAFRQNGVAAVRTLLEQFLDEFQGHLDGATLDE
eukprot:TRINITY_DN16518_c0_g2_i1.p1 TRINITY_DN16518_c0_g2~~TRINITY_DN16518_c0_g2_i1.p1  ORF type:complete len:446 (-),score=87.04 TRINITY_DN16518_c0_g2_i1:340-1629(-)